MEALPKLIARGNRAILAEEMQTLNAKQLNGRRFIIEREGKGKALPSLSFQLVFLKSCSFHETESE